jgi:anti-sigma factor RsiW
MSEMTCRELNDFLVDYESGELAPEVRHRFEEHLLGCPACVAYLRSYDRALREVRSTGEGLDELVPADVPRQLVEAILDSTVRAAKPSRRR